MFNRANRLRKYNDIAPKIEEFVIEELSVNDTEAS